MTTTTATTTATAGSTLAALTATTTLASADGTFFGLSRLRLAGNLDRDLTFKNLFAREFSNGRLSLMSSRKVYKCIANWTVATRIHRNGDAFTAK